jgi:hypothetical protein
MDYCTAHFGKKLDEVTYQDVVGFFTTEKTETDQLEFKSFAGNVNDNYPGLIRTICAFLNSKGGLLIWGAPAGDKPAGRKEKIFQGPLTPTNQILAKDSVISKCSDSITPLPTGIRVAILADGNNGCVCVFEVDESNYSPHQFDKSYLMRIDGQSKPAPHHYIEALFKKIRYPNLEGFLKLTEVSPTAFNGSPHYRIVFSIYFFNWSPLQNEENFSFRVICMPGWFPQINYIAQDHGRNGIEDRQENYREIFYFGEPLHNQYVLLINPITLNDNLTVDIALSFGGRLSPSKSCLYQLNLANPNAFNNPASIVSVITENELLKDGQDKKGVTRESTLNSLGIIR